MIEQVFNNWDKDDMLLYSAAQSVIRQAMIPFHAADEYGVDITELEVLVSEIRELEVAYAR
tara:strand:+ start:2004 stop:2186 length:183 start_codon:yes stop_codon:yes gene_type:complete